MGASMAMHLVRAGYDLFIFSRTREKAKALESAGAIWKDSPAEVSKSSDVVFSILGFPEDVKSVLLGEKGVIKGIKSSSIVVDMTTSSPELAVRIESLMKSKNVLSIDAPVSGGDIGARNASLAVMCGGAKEGYDQILPILGVLGSDVEWFGSAGAGQRTKMSNQILIASTMIGTVESLLYAERANLDLQKVITLLGNGAASSWSLSQLGPRMVKEDWEPGFFIKHFIKDIGIALEDASRMGLQLKGLELAGQFYNEAKAMNFEEKGTQALFQVLRALNKS